MKTVAQFSERRHSTLFKVQGMVIAVARPLSLPPGSVKEVSQTGLIFIYRQIGNNWAVPQSLDIIWADTINTHHLENLPVRTVSDVLIEPEGKPNKSVIRQFAVAFKNLTPHQKNQIGRLIEGRGATKM